MKALLGVCALGTCEVRCGSAADGGRDCPRGLTCSGVGSHFPNNVCEEGKLHSWSATRTGSMVCADVVVEPKTSWGVDEEVLYPPAGGMEGP